MRHLLTFVLLLAALCSCGKPIVLTETDTIQRVFTLYSRQQQKKQQMQLVVSAVSGQPEEIEGFIIHHVVHKKVDLAKARQIFVASLQDFLKIVNEYPEIREQLKTHPMTEESLQYNIGFTTIDGEFYDPPSIAYCYLKDRSIRYCYYDNSFGTFTDYEDVEEPLEEAIRIVQEEKAMLNNEVAQ